MDIQNKYGTLERQQSLLKMMKDLHSFLVENGIYYSMAWGSLIGTIRENGFVPWDDDIDIFMDRHNYNKFLNCCEQMEGYRVEKLLWVNRIKRSSDGFGKYHIPTIDIFVVDNAPDNKFLFNTKVFLLRLLQGMIKKKPKSKERSAKNIALTALHYFGKILPMKVKQDLYEKISQIGNKKKTSCVGCFNSDYLTIIVKYKANFMENLELHKFEDTEFYIVCEYDEHLRQVYGDYMTPPKKSERVALHLD